MSRFYKKQHDVNPWKIKSATMCYDSPWISVFHDEVITPGGGDGIYGSVHFKNHAIGIVPLDKEDHIYLVGQYRYALKRWSWEIPEGGCPIGTDPMDTAKRELKEETGLSAQRWQLISEVDLSNCVSDEIGFIYLAEDLTIGDAQPDESEELELIRIPFIEAYELVQKNVITDSISVIGILQTAILKNELIAR